MSQAAASSFKLIWPDVSTEAGAVKACRIGATALGFISSNYVITFFGILSTGDAVAHPDSDGGLRTFALISLASAVAATLYLAIRVWQYRCPIAAWVGFLWIGNETINALLGITNESFLVFVILLVSAFQGVRGGSAPRQDSSG